MTTPLNPQSYSPQRDSNCSSVLMRSTQDSQDMELIVSESVDDHQNEEIVITNITNKILLTISDDLIFTLSLIGDNFQALMDSIRSDEQLKSDWQSWHRFVSNPNLFYVFIFDNDFGEYVRYRDSQPISHLSKIKIKNKLYVNKSDNHLSPNGLDSLDLDEPTDALVCDQFINNDININNHLSKNINHKNNAVLNTSTYHNYTLSSPSAPLTSTSSHNRSELPQTKASKKEFSSSSTASTSSAKHRSLNANSSLESEDLYEDAPTGPLYEWTQEATFTFLELCKSFSKEIAPAKNVSDVNRTVWEQIAKDLNAKGIGYFDALTCRNHFSRQRSTYTNIICYPAIVNETRWPYFDIMKSIIGEKPIELSRQAKINAKGRFNSKGRKSSAPVMTNSANQEVNELYVALLNLVKKYMNDFLIQKKYETWNRIEKELNAAGFKWNANALRGLFHRLRYTYLNLLKSVGDEDMATQSWPYFRYFQGIDLTAFRGRKLKSMKGRQRKGVNKPVAPVFKMPAKRGRGRPRKHPIQSPNSSQHSMSSTDQINDGINGISCEVTFDEYSGDDSDDAFENKKRPKAH